MNLSTLQSLIANAAWFSRIGQFDATDRAIPFGLVAETDNWDWLPSSRDQSDPIHGDSPCNLAEQRRKTSERKESERIVAKSTLESLRSINDRHPALVDGPHDFTPAAKLAAQFAARMAAREIVVEQCGFWCDVIRLYNEGYWPCGLTADGILVVY